MRRILEKLAPTLLCTASLMGSASTASAQPAPESSTTRVVKPGPALPGAPAAASPATPSPGAASAPATTASPGAASAPATASPGAASAPAAARPGTPSAPAARAASSDAPASAAATSDAELRAEPGAAPLPEPESNGSPAPAPPVAAGRPAEGTRLLPAAPPPSSAEENQEHEDDKGEDDKGEDKKAESDALSFTYGAWVMAGWEYQDERPRNGQPGEDETDFGFVLQQAVFGIDAKYGKRLRLQLDIDFAGVEDPPAGVRDAWLNFRVARAFQLRVGRLKRPFSGLEQRGSSKLPMVGRGLGNALIVESGSSRLGWGDRSETLMLWGRLRPLDLEWSVSASDAGAGAGTDFHARVALSPLPWLTTGIDGAHRIVESTIAPDELVAFDAASIDALVEHGKLLILVDALLAEHSLFPADPPLTASLAGFASYDLAISDDFELQPVLFGEWVDSDLEVARSEAVRFVVGLNSLWRGNTFRVMPQVELIRPLDPIPATTWVARDTFYVMFSGQL